jgi:voltage-gated potassium channel
MSIRKRAWQIVDIAKPGDKVSHAFDIALLSLIFLNVLAVIAGSVVYLQERWGRFLYVFEVFSVIVFTIEYITRLWSCTIDTRFREPIRGRIRYGLQGMSIVDLLSILPFYLPFLGIDLRSLRVLRMLRIIRIAKVGRYYTSLNIIRDVFRAKKEELLLTLGLMGLLLVVASSVLYYCENTAQPDKFSSIPATMWVSIITMTTVGYGDMYPVTMLGKFFGSLIAILGIGMFALPTAILGSGFLDVLQNRKKETAQICPHCGKKIEH